MNLKSFDLCACSGGATVGLRRAGLLHLGGLERNPDAAAIYNANHGNCHILDICSFNPADFESPDYLHTSPPCQTYSAANRQRGEQEKDVAIAHSLAHIIEEWRPQFFTLENVKGYRNGRAFSILVAALQSQGYYCDWELLDAADYGLGQSRKRLILRAVRGGLVPPMLPPVPRRGWYEAIADLLPGLKGVSLAQWQIDSLLLYLEKHPPSRKNIASSLVVEALSSQGIDTTGYPDYSTNCRHPRALLIENTGARSDRPLQVRLPHEPSWTIRAMGQDGHWHRANALLDGKIVALDSRCLARLQGFPDEYRWSDDNIVNCSAIGNAFPPPFMEAVARSLVGAV